MRIEFIKETVNEKEGYILWSIVVNDGNWILGNTNFCTSMDKVVRWYQNWFSHDKDIVNAMEKGGFTGVEYIREKLLTNSCDLEIDNGGNDYPDFANAYLVGGNYEDDDGNITPLNDSELDYLQDCHPDLAQEIALENF